MESRTNIGSLHVRTSMMYGGKTMYLLRIVETLGRAFKILYINHDIDIRSEDPYSTHSVIASKALDKKLNVTMLKVSTLSSISSDVVKQHPVVLIDEAQFFSDLKDAVLYMVEVLNKEVHVVGLSGDYKRNSFGQVLELEPLADDFSTLPSLTLCERCIQYTRRTPALFTHRISMGTEQVEVGSDNYIPVCRKCYMELNPPAKVAQ